MDWKIEVIIVPVKDVDRSKQFYSEQLGLHVDVDHRATENVSGKSCSGCFLP